MNERGVERRLAAILAADVVGYSRLMEQNEDGTVVRLGRHRKELVEPLVATHRGRVVKLMGDGVLCEFGSVVDALHCAMRIQEEMAEREKDTPPGERIRLRIGINTGDVIVEDGDIYGSGVNVASRLEQLCEPGGVLVSGTVYDQLYGRSDVALDFVGEQQVKNIDRPVRIYRAHTTDSGPASAETKLAPASEPPSLAVLPFIVLGGGPKWERLAKGISGDIVTDLARHHEDVFVLGSNSSFAYKNCAGDIRQVGREL
ncbi:MAG TPA: adenylate/guanylate cyclase domain-containing protein, partial [Inquilinus sp.]